VQVTDEALPDDVATSLASAVRSFGSFEPPLDYAFEPELRGPAPRRVPWEIEHGRIAETRRKHLIGGIVLGLFFIGLGLLPRFGIARESLKLQAVLLAGCGTIAMTIGAVVFHWLRRGPLAYIEDSVPLVARICDLVVRPKRYMHGEVVTVEFAALTQLRDPSTGLVSYWEMTSSELPAAQKDRYTTTFRVGDYATAVYLPTDPQGTLRLYGFLDLKHDLGVVRKPEGGGGQARTIVKIVLALAGVFVPVLLTLYAMASFQPIALTPARLIASLAWGPLAFGIPVLWLMAREAQLQRQRLAERNEQARLLGEAVDLDAAGPSRFGADSGWIDAAIVGGVMVMAAVMSYGVTLVVNGALDNAQPRKQEVIVTGLTTSRVYFRFAGGNKIHSLRRDPSAIPPAQGNQARAIVRDGWLGWQWVQAIEPRPKNVRQAP
jgi:hypothetical protein